MELRPVGLALSSPTRSLLHAVTSNGALKGCEVEQVLHWLPVALPPAAGHRAAGHASSHASFFSVLVLLIFKFLHTAPF